MAFCITFGTHGVYLVDISTLLSSIPRILIQATEFTGMLEGYEQVRAYCYNCHSSPFASFGGYDEMTNITMTQPLIPLSTHKYKEVLCYTCRVSQDLRDRPDITPETRPPPQMAWGPQPPPQAYGGYQQQPPPQQQQQQQQDYK
ncbi:hypothetical protein N7509_003459 [Penicillium cosmopolitanum]|uniref:Uncharacterized protein n=1 Tax=Penicillium cosmopolitanum TaxID=1131564 RepID=A0A9X0BBH0_9EURO|nr:uncharacterized protein N7509_003459 [Penicillium cosmopolitanum]KAJ5403588.1 hypothetical protein N7509_003459 [Penicillium cosmopolitanum]